MDLTENLKDYAEEKINRFEKYLANITEATVTLSVEKYRHKAEVLLKINGVIIQAESITGEMYSSIDEVVEKLESQVRKYKEKVVSRRKNMRQQTDSLPEEENQPMIIKNKSFDIKPMSVEEAAVSMEMMDRSFFVFTNASSGDINVLYKRNDGNLGLIEPVK
jgi:putative sigma-54 modulation protein